MPRQILVIDDEKSICSLLRQLFERQGYQVLLAGNGNAGIQLFKENPVDLVIVDLIMPEKDGIETIRELKLLDADIKIIAISGGGVIRPDLYLKLARKFGAIYSFQKPIQNDEMLAFVKNLFNPPTAT
ncbi:MAG: response regulator [Proteobacteria bacterium]|nr:response regulator [Desulfobacula sp.]MBU3954092.1 response regulator [Pseudomonadota bacterium]MBU4131650.1 response regulator [Pseudomonadota bacterium]